MSVSRDEMAVTQRIVIRCLVDGEVVLDCSTVGLYFGVAEIFTPGLWASTSR